MDTPSIDRQALVRRHNPVHEGSPDISSPLSVGNGDFAFTVDCLGLQTLGALYEDGTPLCTQASWGWHSFPRPEAARMGELEPRAYDTYGRPVGYATSPEGQEELYRWLRESPHRLNLARVVLSAARPRTEEPIFEHATDVRQELDLWTGVIESRFSVLSRPVRVLTACHPDLDAVAFAITSPLCRTGDLGLTVCFPYASPSITASDWASPSRHQTVVAGTRGRRVEILRTLDAQSYRCTLHLGRAATAERCGAHEVKIRPAAAADDLALVCELSPGPGTGRLLDAEEVLSRSREQWKRFWSTGGCVSLEGSADPRATELERRIVLSRYLTAIQCSGRLPPQETGLTCNSWYGKFHLEMHYWHAAHFPLWGRPDLLERSLPWYRTVSPRAAELARSQGYRGVRWPKMVGPEGIDSPSPIGPLLIWQQPHFITLAELCYRARPVRELLERYADLVFASADFMASYAHHDGTRYVLGPPLIPAQENHRPDITVNPTFELEYWDFGLRLAQTWRERLGLPPEPTWQAVLDGLAELPQAGGVYLAHEACPDTYDTFGHDHPSMVAALGMLPGRKADARVMGVTLDRIRATWDFDSTWGWDFPLLAMAAARLGRPRDALGFLLMECPKNTYLANGHNPQRPRRDLPLYLPGNGALLIAVALMVAGWDGATAATPGFPDDGSWKVSWEGLLPLP